MDGKKKKLANHGGQDMEIHQGDVGGNKAGEGEGRKEAGKCEGEGKKGVKGEADKKIKKNGEIFDRIPRKVRLSNLVLHMCTFVGEGTLFGVSIHRCSFSSIL